MSCIMGIDLGTTRTKVGIFDPTGRAISLASAPTPTEREGESATHRPEELWDNVCSLIRKTCGDVDPSRIRGVGVASVAEAGLPIDKAGKALYPIIAWFDPRTRRESEWWAKNVGARKVFSITGLFPQPIYSINKIMWLRDRESAVYRAMARWLCMTDFLVWKLTGIQATNFSIASRTMALDLSQHRWSEELLELAGVNASVFPTPHWSHEVVGEVTGRAASETGLPARTPVVAGGHDHICGSVAAGVIAPGAVLDSCGSVESLLVPLPRPETGQAWFEASFSQGCHAVRDTYYMMGGIHTATLALDWAQDLLVRNRLHETPGREQPDRAPDQAFYDAGMTEAASSPPGARGLFFVPHLRGSGPPVRDPLASGLLLGIRLSHTRGDIIRAVLEGLCYELRATLGAIESLAGQSFPELRCIGGGSRNKLWMQIKADVLGKRLLGSRSPDAACLGAALLAGLGTGVYRGLQEISAMDLWEERVNPSAEEHSFYERAFTEVYSAMGRQVRPLWTAIGVLA